MNEIKTAVFLIALAITLISLLTISHDIPLIVSGELSVNEFLEKNLLSTSAIIGTLIVEFYIGFFERK